MPQPRNTYFADKDQAFIQRHLSCQSDGPVTVFVMMARACEAVANGGDPDAAANALYEEMVELGALKPGSGDEPLLESNEY